MWQNLGLEAATWGRTLPWCKKTVLDSDPHVANCRFQFVFKRGWVSFTVNSLSFHLLVFQNMPLLNYYFRGEPGCFHSTLSVLLSGSKWYTHVSSPVTILPSKPGSSLRRHKNLVATSIRCCSWGSVSCLGTHLTHTFRYHKVVMQYCGCRTRADVWHLGHFWHTNPSVFSNESLRAMDVVLRARRWRASRLSFVRHTCSSRFKPCYPFVKMSVPRTINTSVLC